MTITSLYYYITKTSIYLKTLALFYTFNKYIDKLSSVWYTVYAEVRMMANITSAIRDTISISLFNRGLAGKIFEEVKQSGAKVVMKNNSAECVLLSPEEYVKLMDEVNDARLLNTANERMQNFNPANLISGEELYKDLGITKADLDAIGEVEFE